MRSPGVAVEINAGGVLLFPFIRLFAPFRHYALGFIVLAHFAYVLSQITTPPTPTVHSDDPRLANIVAYEDLLRQKAECVLHRFDTSSHSIDLSVAIDHTTITTTTSHAASSEKEVRDNPQVRHIKVCVTLSKDDNIDKDELFRALSYSLGIDLARGDMLRLVFM